MLYISPDRRIFKYSRGPYPTEYEQNIVAIGSGMDFAVAAMQMGGTAIDAVKLACANMTDCGNGMDVLTLENYNGTQKSGKESNAKGSTDKSRTAKESTLRIVRPPNGENRN